MINLDKYLQAGKTFRIYYGDKALANRRVHIRAIVDDIWIVFRVWSPGKNVWRYHIEHRYYFELANENDHLIV